MIANYIATYQIRGQFPGESVSESNYVESYYTASDTCTSSRSTRIALTFVEEHDRALQFPRRIRPGYVQVVEHV
jgi:hypothetical protein